MKLKLTSIGLALALASVARADFNPVALTPGSYTFDIVVESNTAQALPYCITADTGSGARESDTSLYEQGFYARLGQVGGNSGIPLHNTAFTSMNNSNIQFLMPPNYITNNDLQVDNYTYSSGTLTFNTPRSATNLAVLATSGGGGSTVSYTVTHSDNSTETGTFNVPDWFNGGPTVAWGANGRVQPSGGYENFNNSSVNNQAPYLYDDNITVSGAIPITSITFTYNTGGEYNFYAISGNASGPAWTPIPVSGFNQIVTVPAAFPLTATMDQGTNTENNQNLSTWFEQGYYQDTPSDGLPPSASTFSSQSQPTHHYQMGNYSANNAILIDTNHLVANITPTSPAPYYAFAFLTAGASIGSGQMTNVCVLQHQDGVSETNLFYGYDWFNTSFSGAIAFEANGRVNMYNRTLNQLGNNFPFLFETYFSLSDTASPVTNIVVKFGSAPAANSTTYIMAVSASATGVGPVITEQPSPTNQTWFPSQTATFTVQVVGTAPITNSWLVESNGVFYRLKDGVDANGSTISGSSTTTLTISDLTIADGTNYEYIATNAFGGETSAPALLIINSGTPVATAIDSQTPPASPAAIDVLTNHVVTTSFSVTIDASSAPPFFYQWYNGSPQGPSSPIIGATNATYLNVDTNNATIFCIVSNFVGSATNSPVSIVIVSPPAPSAYESAILSYKPVSYWPLNETTGTTAFDYSGTNDGTYEGGYTLGQPGLPATLGIGANTSVNFDGTSGEVDIPVGNLNITGPLTLIEWVQTSGESDFGSPLGHSDQSYRFAVDGGGIAHFADDGPDVTSTSSIADGNWHQLVGVYDGVTQYLYVDGQRVGTPVSSAPAGSEDDLLIAGAPDYGNRFFSGNITQVAILTNALTASEVQSVYNSLDAPPTVSIAPGSPSAYAGASITLTATPSGAPPVRLQWYFIDNSNNSNNIAGATNTTYTVVDPSISQNGYTYGVIAINAYGSSTGTVTLAVQNGPAYIAADLSPLTGEAFVGAPVTYTVGAAGSAPLFYQWTLDGTNVSGATNSSFTTAAQCGVHTIQVVVTNAQNEGTPAISSPATLQGDAYPTNITFNTNGTGWQLNGGGTVPTLSSNVLELTDGTDGEASSAFYGVAQYAGSFTASFTYVGDGGADGAAFILEDSSAGTLALGGGGGALGYFGITNSVALEFNLYIFPGIAPGTNGNTYGSGAGIIYGTTGAVHVNSADPINVDLSFANGILAVKLTDTTTFATYSTNYQFGPLTPLLGGSDLAYVGFSGADGGTSSIQTFSNFEFNSVIPPVTLAASSVTAGSFVLSWPAADTSYVLQEAASLSDRTTWSPGPTPVVVGGLNEVTVTVPHGGGEEFYRLARVVTCP